MATNINNAFIDLWNDEVHHLFQQRGSKLMNVTRKVSGVTGATHKFHTLGAVIANTKVRDAEVTPLNPAQAVVTATLVDAYAPIYIDKLDEIKTNADFRREYVQTTANALGRYADQDIIAAMDASNGGTDTAGGGALTVARVLDAKRKLDEADVPMEDRYLVVSPAALEDMLNQEKVTSADYQTVKALIRGDINSALGFQWIMSTQLTADASPSQRFCYAFQRSAVGCAVGMDLTTEVNYIPQRAAYLVNSFLSMGSVTIEAAGVIQLPVDQ